jgi:phosphatidylserine/phosphatidylglycerophosphate/cardiolipin synthase-like enzyme
MSPSPAARPPDRIVIARSERRDTVLDLIRGARSRVTLSLFRCSDQAVFDELQQAVRRGVDVDVMITSRAKGGKKKLRKLWSRLEETGVRLSAYTDPVVKYHAKYLVVDDGPALVASLNFTRKCFEDTCDALVVTHDPGVIEGLRTLMATDRAGGVAPETVSDRLIVGPERARRQVRTLIEGARTSIQVIDAKVSDPALIALLSARRSEGLAVEIHSQKDLGGVQSHGKMMLIDGTRAIVGSLALTALSLDFRREVAVRVDDPAAVAEIAALFRSLGSDTRRLVPSAAAGGV